MYAIGPSGKGFRAVNSQTDLLPGETFSTTLPVMAPDLVAHANEKQWKLATGGYAVSFTGGPTIPFGTDADGLALLNGAVVRQGQANPPATVYWQTGQSTFLPLTGSQITAAGVKVADFISATFDTLRAVLNAIQSGSMTTTAQIDASAWPSNAGTV